MTAPDQQPQEFNQVQFIVDDLSAKIGQLNVEISALKAEIARRDAEAKADA